MLLWTTLLCLLSANLVLSQFAKPGVLADNGTALKPHKGKLQKKDSADDLHLIRSLLKSRQTGCPTGFAECPSTPNTCCPSDGSCCQTGGCCDAGSFCYSTGCCPTGSNGCEGNSCCQAGESCCTGGGCCDAGSYCTTVDGIPGCCPNGETCTAIDPECQTPTYVVCPGETFCCPPGYMCYRDATGNPTCSPGGTSIPPSLTQTTLSTTNGLTGVFSSLSSSSSKSLSSSSSKSSSTSSSKSQGNVPLFPKSSSSSTPSPTPSTSSSSKDSSGISSSAISVAVDTILASLAAVGVFAHLF